jgi:hypothetical protein
MSEPPNGKHKAFELTPPKSPEEIAHDQIKATIPKLRRECSRDPRLKRCVGAKWLFCQLTDDSFLNSFGGDGWGKVYASLTEMRQRYGHDDDTLKEWANRLVETGWIWIQRKWPRWCFGIASITRQPELFAPDYVRVMAKASAEQAEDQALNKTASGGFAPTNEKTADFGVNHRERREGKPPVAVLPTASDGENNRERRYHQPPVTAGSWGERRETPPLVGVGDTVTGGVSNRQSREGTTATGGNNKETPGKKESLEVIGGGDPPPDWKFQKWVKGLEEMYPSNLRKLQKDLDARFRAARSDNARREWKRRIEAVDERLLGGKVPDAPKPAPVVRPALAPKEPTPEDILEGARYLVSIGKTEMLTKAQRSALQRAGE